MTLSPREREILHLLREHPMFDAQRLADVLGTTKGAVAVALSSLTRKGEILGRGYVVRDAPYVAVVGGSVMDIKARSSEAIVAATSNPGEVSTTPGGVGRNIAENLGRLGRRTRLLSIVGRDAFGDLVLEHTARAGVEVENVVRGDLPTGTYLAALDRDGELYVGLSDMRATDELTVPQLAGARDCLARADIVVLDGNMPLEVATWVLDIAAAHGVRVVVEPVSVAKAGRLAPLLDGARPVFCLTPNVDELGELVGANVGRDARSIAAAAKDLHARGVEQVWVRRGRNGSLLCVVDERPLTIDMIAADVVDVTGAGDSMTAAYVHALLRADRPFEAARFGHAVASLTVASGQTVRPDLTEASADALLTTSVQKETR